MITPQVGDRMYYWPSLSALDRQEKEMGLRPRNAQVCKVNTPNSVNLAVWDEEGTPAGSSGLNPVRILQDEADIEAAFKDDKRGFGFCTFHPDYEGVEDVQEDEGDPDDDSDDPSNLADSESDK